MEEFNGLLTWPTLQKMAADATAAINAADKAARERGDRSRGFERLRSGFLGLGPGGRGGCRSNSVEGVGERACCYPWTCRRS